MFIVTYCFVFLEKYTLLSCDNITFCDFPSTSDYALKVVEGDKVVEGKWI